MDHSQKINELESSRARWRVLCAILAFAIIAGIPTAYFYGQGSIDTDAYYTNGYNKGHAAGVLKGYDDGQSDGYESGYRDGKNAANLYSYTPPTQTPSTSYSATDSDYEITVYITDTGNKYHRYTCQYLYDSCYSISLEDAIYEGYEPCSVCNPPE